MRQIVLYLSLGYLAVSCTAGAAETFSFDMPQPRIRVIVPDVPQIKMGVHPFAAAHPDRDCAARTERMLLSRYALVKVVFCSGRGSQRIEYTSVWVPKQTPITNIFPRPKDKKFAF